MGFPKKVIATGILLIAVASGLWFARNSLLETALEKWFSQAYGPFLAAPLSIEGVSLDPSLSLSIHQIKVPWKTAEGTFFFEISNLHVLNPLTDFLLRRPIKITFETLRPLNSVHPGMTGRMTLFQDALGTVEVQAEFLGLYLEEMIALNPENLTGAKGKLTGLFYLRATESGDQEFHLELKSEPPGGKLQARFFDVLVPFLPSAQKQVMEAVRKAGTVHYQEADVDMRRISPTSINLVLHLLIPDYNLNLNLNVELRVESEDAFFELAQLMGLVQGGRI